MTGRRVLFLLAVGVFMGLIAGAAIANEQGMGSWDASLSADPERAQLLGGGPYSGEIREPVEAASVPDRPDSSSGLGSDTHSGEPTVEIGGRMFRTGIDDGP